MRTVSCAIFLSFVFFLFECLQSGTLILFQSRAPQRIYGEDAKKTPTTATENTDWLTVYGVLYISGALQFGEIDCTNSLCYPTYKGCVCIVCLYACLKFFIKCLLSLKGCTVVCLMIKQWHSLNSFYLSIYILKIFSQYLNFISIL